MGLEPTASSVTGLHSNQLSYYPWSGWEGVAPPQRRGYLLIFPVPREAGEEGFEPPTNALEVRGSIQLSYSPMPFRKGHFLHTDMNIITQDLDPFQALASSVSSLGLVDLSLLLSSPRCRHHASFLADH